MPDVRPRRRGRLKTGRYMRLNSGLMMMLTLRRAAGWSARAMSHSLRPSVGGRRFGDVARRSIVQGAEETTEAFDYAAEEAIPKVRIVNGGDKDEAAA